MNYFNENKLLFYSAIQGHDLFIKQQFETILSKRIDWSYFIGKARYLGVTGCFIRRIGDSDYGIGKKVIEFLKGISDHEINISASMLSLYKEVSALLSRNGIEHIPLKGCDKRIKRGDLNFFNMMTDIDILVRTNEIEKTGAVLSDNGYNYQGCFSGAHMNFYTSETTPRFIEIHWDVVNRSSSFQKALFLPSVENIWERSLPEDKHRILCWGDMLMHLTAHSIKEYFHKPKWLADIAWLLDTCPPETDFKEITAINKEWNTSKGLGVVTAILDKYLDNSYMEKAFSFGAKKPNWLKQRLAERMIDYQNLISLRGYVYMACADSNLDLFKIYIDQFFGKYMSKK